MARRKRILVIGFPGSIHVARWMRHALEFKGAEFFFFPSQRGSLHPILERLRSRDHFRNRVGGNAESTITLATNEMMQTESVLGRAADKWLPWPTRSQVLTWVLRRLEPDLVHCLEFQHAGYLYLQATRGMDRQCLPKLWITNYGSDLFLYRHIGQHHDRLMQLLDLADFYSSDCERDRKIACDLGFKGYDLGIIVASGGVDTRSVRRMRSGGKISERSIIAVKGFQGFAGRAVTALQALRLVADQLRRYEVILYGADQDVALEAEWMASVHAMRVRCLPQRVPHEDILRLMGRARVAIGIGLSDGVPSALLEAMTMGAFPIQTRSAAAEEWIEDGKSGFIVDLDNTSAIAERISTAVRDDDLVNRAAERNWETISDRLEFTRVTAKIVSAYHAATSGVAPAAVP